MYITEKIGNRLEFAEKVRELAAENKENWENCDLVSFLNAMARYVEDDEARIEHGNLIDGGPNERPFPQNFDWEAAFWILSSGKYYE